jgi:hypothetical protein
MATTMMTMTMMTMMMVAQSTSDAICPQHCHCLFAAVAAMPVAEAAEIAAADTRFLEFHTR